MDHDGKDQRQITDIGIMGHFLRWSADGQFIYFRSLIMDVIGHKQLWVSPLNGGKPEMIFEFDNPDARIDYPVWSPDGKWILFDKFQPQGGDIWIMKNFE